MTHFKEVAKKPAVYNTMELGAAKGDPFALASLGGALYQRGVKGLASEYFKAAIESIPNTGDGQLEHAIATLISRWR